LWTSQHLDAFDIEKCGGCGSGSADVDAVQVIRDARFKRRIGRFEADAADGDSRLTEKLTNIHVRHGGGQALQIG
jgi:hypothetical protein